MTALSDTEQATLDRIEAAEPAPESLRERVARAIAATDGVDFDHYLTGELDLDNDYLRNADAAIAVMRGQA